MRPRSQSLSATFALLFIVGLIAVFSSGNVLYALVLLALGYLSGWVVNEWKHAKAEEDYQDAEIQHIRSSMDDAIHRFVKENAVEGKPNQDE